MVVEISIVREIKRFENELKTLREIRKLEVQLEQLHEQPKRKIYVAVLLTNVSVCSCMM